MSFVLWTNFFFSQVNFIKFIVDLFIINSLSSVIIGIIILMTHSNYPFIFLSSNKYSNKFDNK